MNFGHSIGRQESGIVSDFFGLTWSLIGPIWETIELLNLRQFQIIVQRRESAF